MKIAEGGREACEGQCGDWSWRGDGRRSVRRVGGGCVVCEGQREGGEWWSGGLGSPGVEGAKRGAEMGRRALERGLLSGGA